MGAFKIGCGMVRGGWGENGVDVVVLGLGCAKSGFLVACCRPPAVAWVLGG